MVMDRANNPGKFSTVVVSEGARFRGMDEMTFTHSGIGETVAQKLRKASAKFNNGKRVDTIVQNLGYLVRSGYPDATDSMVPIAYSNIAMELILNGEAGRMASIRNGVFTSVDINEVAAGVKQVDVQRCYNTELLVPEVKTFTSMPMLMMTATEMLSKKN
jgi:6-phosphofructokinase 1